jgi:gliding motility-associated-like protein
MKPMKQRYLLLFSLLFPLLNRAQTLVFAELTGSPNVITTGWNLAGAAYSGDTGGDVNAFPDEIILTDAVNTSSGSIFYNEAIDLSTCYQWKVEFDFRMWEGSAADGIAFCFLDVPPTGFVNGGGVGIPASSDGVFVILDTWDNGCGTNPALQIYQGAGYNECGPGMINQADGLNFLRSSDYQTCLIEYNSGLLTVSINGMVYLTGNYNANIVGYMGFTASTGGATDKHSIRNVKIFADIAIANAGPDVTICSGETAQLGDTVNPSYTYNWTGGAELSSTSISNPTVTLTNTSSIPTTYTYTLQTTLTNAPTSCPDNDVVVVTVNPAVISVTDSTICQGESVVFFGQTLTNAGLYSQDLQTATGCDSIVNLNLTVNPLPLEPVVTSNAPVACPGDSVTLTASSSPTAQFSWTGPQNFSSTDSALTFSVQTENVGYYSVFATLNGCFSDVISIPVSIGDINAYEVVDFPNVITPNGDGINDSLELDQYFKSCQSYSYAIFNRWGQLVFEQNQDSPSFLGKTQDGTDLANGTYFYQLIYGDQQKSGFLQIVR